MFSFRRIERIEGGWLLLAVIVFTIIITLLFVRSCSNAGTHNVPQINEDSLINANIELQRQLIEGNKMRQEQAQVYQRKIDSAHIVLAATNLKVDELTNKGELYRKKLNSFIPVSDTGLVDVYPSYIAYCDSIADLNARWPNLFSTQKKEYSSITDALNEQLNLKNKDIEAANKQISTLQTQNAWLTKGVNEIAKKNQPRNKIFFGPSLAGTQETPIYAIGLGAALLNKKEQLLSVDALMLKGGELMYKVSGKFKISFR